MTTVRLPARKKARASTTTTRKCPRQEISRKEDGRQEAGHQDVDKQKGQNDTDPGSGEEDESEEEASGPLFIRTQITPALIALNSRKLLSIM